MHYFTWLKALGDQNLRLGVPSSFQQSWRLFRSDFGVKMAGLVAVISLAAVLMYLFLPFREARAIYLAAVGIHGFVELMGVKFSHHAKGVDAFDVFDG